MQLYNINSQSIAKVCVFDFDETMYYSPTQHDAYINFIKNSILDLSNYSPERADEIIKEFGFDQVGEKRVSFGKNCESFGISQDSWNEYKIDHFYEVDYNNSFIVPNELYRRLAEKMPIYIVSNEIKENLIYKAQKLGIDLSNFTDIFAPQKSNPIMIDKMTMMADILSKNNLDAKNLFAVGDRFNVDIKPALTLGGMGVEVRNTDEVAKIINALLTGNLNSLN